MKRDAAALASLLLGSVGLTLGLAVAAERRRAARVQAWNDAFRGRTVAIKRVGKTAEGDLAAEPTPAPFKRAG